jgi:phosphoesterase RecJ-like protein
MMGRERLDQEIVSYGKARMRVYRTIYNAIKRYDRIVVFRHIKPDFDALGSQMGIYTFIKDNFPEKDVHFVGDNHVSFTPRIFPVAEKLPESYYEKPFLAIVVDVGDDERIAGPMYKKASYIVKIDHHPCKKEIAKHPLLDEGSAAAAEMVTDLFANWKGTHVSKEAARYLYIGITGDSGRFMYQSTTAHTFACAQYLLGTGIDIHSIYLEMYEKKLADLKVTSYILAHFSVTEHGVAYYTLPIGIQTELSITPERGKENVNLFSNIEEVNAWCSVTEDPKAGVWWISIRSKDKDISGIAAKWNGGGHPNASGAKIKSLSELDGFLKDLDGLFA